MRRLLNMVRVLSTGLSVWFSMSLAVAADIAIPLGWRVPTASELSDDWRRSDVERYSSVIGDFNGDGLPDKAMLLISEKDGGLGLFAFLATRSGRFQSYKLDVINEGSWIEVMGIALVSPGEFKTACGKGYFRCKNGEPPKLNLRRDAVDYFKSGSANSYFVWDSRAGKFRRYWMSD